MGLDLFLLEVLLLGFKVLLVLVFFGLVAFLFRLFKVLQFREVLLGLGELDFLFFGQQVHLNLVPVGRLTDIVPILLKL